MTMSRVLILLLAGPVLVAGAGASSGATVTHAVSTPAELAAALAAAEANGAHDDIRLAQGTYPGPYLYVSDEAFDVTLRGGYDSAFTARSIDPAGTVLTGPTGGGAVLTLVSSAPSVPNRLHVESLTIRNGEQRGLKVLAGNGDVTVRQCAVLDNEQLLEEYGGGMQLSAAGRAEVSGCTIAGNVQGGLLEGGGGLDIHASHKAVVANNRFIMNRADSGGACTFRYCVHLFFLNNVVYGNAATFSGGGVQAFSCYRHVLLNNTIVDNDCWVATGGDSLALTLARPDDTVELRNNIMLGVGGLDVGIYTVDAAQARALVDHHILNNGFVFDAAEVSPLSSPIAFHPGNLDSVDPLFTDESAMDLRLAFGSPCVDAGDGFVRALTLEDIDGNPRSVDGDLDALAAPDIGAHEFVPVEVELPEPAWYTPGNSYVHEVYLANRTPFTLTAYFCSRVLTPAGRAYPDGGYLVPPEAHELQPYERTGFTQALWVPAGTQPGTFDYYGYSTWNPGADLIDRSRWGIAVVAE